MNPTTYNLKITDLDEPKGQIKAQDLRRLLGALLQTAERATRLLATGESVSTGKPKWLEACTDFIVSDLKEGSTVVAMSAPTLEDTARDQFSQKEFWQVQPELDETSLDLALYAIADACSESRNSDRYDAQVLDSILSFKSAIKSKKASIELISTKQPRLNIKLTQDTFTHIKNKKSELPDPRAFIVSGKLDMISHSAGSFYLVLSNGEKLLGKIHGEFLDESKLQSLWGKDTTVEGIVHFKANGKPRMIDTRKLTLKQIGDEIFEEMPYFRADRQQGTLFPEFKQAAGQADPMCLWNLWDGEESIDELLAELD